MKGTILNRECSLCQKVNSDPKLCLICCNFGLFESIDHEVLFPDLHHSDPDRATFIPTARRIIEYLLHENHSLKKENSDLRLDVDRWRGLVLAFLSPAERQDEMMDPMNRLLFKFLSGPWAN